MITYKFLDKDSRELKAVFEVNLNRKPSLEPNGELSREPSGEPSREPSSWTTLTHKQCKICPLSPDEHKWCPPALDLESLVNSFGQNKSTDRFFVEVSTPHRIISKEVDLQTALQSLMGLLMATSGCPILSHFKFSAFHHLPFATFEETMVRNSAYYLLKQFFVDRSGGEPDYHLSKLTEVYRLASQVNSDFYARLQGSSDSDANGNALIVWNSLSQILAISVEDMLDAVKYRFVD